jgi:hypothetical protein
MITPDLGAMHIRTALSLVVFSIVLGIAIFFGWLNAPWWTAVIPVGYAWARPSLYRLISDANYSALHRFEADFEQDIQISQDIRLNEAVTLDAEKMLRGLRIDDERAGRA